MGLLSPRRVRTVAGIAAAGALALGLTGAGTLKKKKEAAPPKVEETVGNLAFIQSVSETKLEGVGLVVGLDDTGVDPPPSPYRTKLIEDLRRAQVENPNQWLKNPKVSMVIVRMTIPVGASPKDRLDATVELAPASGTKSLIGGHLLECRLREVMVLGGSTREGQDFAFVSGPVMTGSQTQPDNVKLGRILGGARVRREIPFQLILDAKRKSFRTSAMVEAVVNQRFPQSEGVEQKGSVKAKTDQYLELKIPRVYHLNESRFFRVVKLLPMIDSPSLRSQRMIECGRDLLDPAKAGIAALRLEGFGPNSVDILKTGLQSANSQVRFFAAEALAFLNDPSGADVLTETVKTRPEFRAYALAALAATDQAAFHMGLRRLMDTADVEVRYGAFNALRTISPDDPFLGQVRVLDDPHAVEPDAETDDSMAVAISRSAARRHKDDPFSLYLVDCDGPPMVHVARTRRCEIVVFGRGQKFLPPIVLGKGPYLLNASENDQSVQISKIVPSKFGDGDAKVDSGLEMGDVLRRAANLGATYPELVAILQAAERQKNLPGPLVVDAVPGASPSYVKAAILGEDLTSKKDVGLKRTKLDETKPKRRSVVDRLFGRGR